MLIYLGDLQSAVYALGNKSIRDNKSSSPKYLETDENHLSSKYMNLHGMKKKYCFLISHILELSTVGEVFFFVVCLFGVFFVSKHF